MSLLDLLTSLTFDEIRTLAAKFHRRRRGDTHVDRIQAVHQLWLDPQQRTNWLATLSPTACHALWRLLQSLTIPALLFFGEFGKVQRTKRSHTSKLARSHVRSIENFSAAFELYQIGLLHGATGEPIDQADHLTIPIDLHQALSLWLDIQNQRHLSHPQHSMVSNTVAISLTQILLHDLVQLLAHTHANSFRSALSSTRLTLQHSKLLANRLLFTPDPLQESLSEEQQILQWLRYLHWLATRAGLLLDGRPQATMWYWLEQTPTEQLRHLWNRWLPTVGMDTQQPPHPSDAPLHLPAIWRNAFPNQPTTLFSVQDLTHRLLAPSDLPLAALLAWFDSLTAIDEQFARLLTEHLLRWGVVESVDKIVVPFLQNIDPETALPTAPFVLAARYRLTEIGYWLFFPETADKPDWCWKTGSKQWQFRSISPTQEALDWYVLRDWDGEPSALVRLAPFLADYQWHDDETSASTGMAISRMHRLQFDRTAIIKASVGGASAAQVWEVVQRAQFPFPISDYQRLLAWFAEASAVELTLLPILRTDSAKRMMQLQTTPALYSYFDELFTPTVTTWRGDKDAFLKQLAKLGLYPQSWSQQTEVESQELAAGALETEEQRLEIEPFYSQSPIRKSDFGTLWLSMNLYTWMGTYTSLPAPVSSHLSNQLLAALSEEEQSALQQQLRQIKSTLEDAMDQLPHTPPTHPSNPDDWRAVINQALEIPVDLEILHFSAGRNLTVQRRVTPHYIDEVRFGGPALRGWCHSSGRDLWFRLDRIQQLKITENDIH